MYSVIFAFMVCKTNFEKHQFLSYFFPFHFRDIYMYFYNYAYSCN